MILVYSLSCLADLLNDKKSFLLLDDTLDPWILMTGYDDEAVAVPSDAVVVGGWDRERLETRNPAAFAMKRQRPLNLVAFCACFDSSIDIAEDLLVTGSAIGELHRAPIIPLLGWRLGPRACLSGVNRRASAYLLMRARRSRLRWVLRMVLAQRPLEASTCLSFDLPAGHECIGWTRLWCRHRTP